MTTSTLLVIGGGIGGCTAIAGFRKKDKATKIVLVEPKDFSDVNWAAYRTPFDPAIAARSLAPLAAFVEQHNVEHKMTTVSKLTKDMATLADGTTIEFDACVVATGAHMKWDLAGRSADAANNSRETRLESLKTEGPKILQAKSVMVVGGGLVGVELAGDIKAYSSKEGNTDMKVTLVHSGDRLCPEMAPAASTMVKKQLEQLGITVILNDKAEESSKGVYKLASNGSIVAADIVIPTTGLKSCNDFIDIAGAKTASGFLETDDCFRVNNSGGKVFAIGDCCTTLRNSGAEVMNNVASIGSNLNATITAVRNGTPLKDTKLKPFSSMPPVMVVTTGLKTGTADLGCTHTRFVLPGVKQSSMFLFSRKQNLGIDGEV